MRKLFLGFAAWLVGGAASMAADPVVYVPTPSPPVGHFSHQSAPFDWTGWYFGGYAAYVSGGLTGDSTEPAISQLDGGAQLHYNMMVDSNWVFSPFVIVPLPGVIKETEFKVDWSVIGGARLGYAHGRWLPYAFIAAELAGVTSVSNGSNTHTGILGGAGVEYAIDDHWTIGARYAYLSMGAQDYNGSSVGWRGHSIAATLNFKLH